MPEYPPPPESPKDILKNALQYALTDDQLRKIFHEASDRAIVDAFFKLRTVAERWDISWTDGLIMQQTGGMEVKKDISNVENFYWTNQFVAPLVLTGHTEAAENYYSPKNYQILLDKNEELLLLFQQGRFSLARDLLMPGNETLGETLALRSGIPASAEVYPFAFSVFHFLGNEKSLDDIDTMEESLAIYLGASDLPTGVYDEELRLARLAWAMRAQVPSYRFKTMLETLRKEESLNGVSVIASELLRLAVRRGPKDRIYQLIHEFQVETTTILGDDLMTDELDFHTLLAQEDVSEPMKKDKAQKIKELTHFMVSAAEQVAGIDPELSQLLFEGNSVTMKAGILHAIRAIPEDRFLEEKIQAYTAAFSLVRIPQIRGQIEELYKGALALAGRRRTPTSVLYRDIIHAAFAAELASVDAKESHIVEKQIRNLDLKWQIKEEIQVSHAKYTPSALRQWEKMLAESSESGLLAEKLALIALEKKDWQTLREIIMKRKLAPHALADIVYRIEFPYSYT